MKKLLTVIVLCNLSALGVAHAKETKAAVSEVKVEPKRNGLVNKKSAYSVKETLDRLEAVLKKKGIPVVLRWSHSAHAKAVNIPLRPTELLLFGNPKMGSKLFTSAQSAGIDLPMKALAWKDAKGQVWLTYNDPVYLARRHGIENRGKVIHKMSKGLAHFTDVATQEAPVKKTSK